MKQEEEGRRDLDRGVVPGEDFGTNMTHSGLGFRADVLRTTEVVPSWLEWGGGTLPASEYSGIGVVP